MKTQRIYLIEDWVKQALETRPATRSDDFLLIREVCGKISPALEDPMYSPSFSDVLNNHEYYGIPSMETITRCRRKLQKIYPELKAEKEVEIARFNEQQEYERYGLDI